MKDWQQGTVNCISAAGTLGPSAWSK